MSYFLIFAGGALFGIVLMCILGMASDDIFREGD